ncbi:uncharacterized protein [Palaemon carinicauda]|uniref:uncharacterized protein n=1 Tax=Palaemon carinicauda TaxID=392227 RepID=UPI0035B5D73B
MLPTQLRCLFLPDYSQPSSTVMPRKFVSQGKLTVDRKPLEEAFKHRVETGCSLRAACKQFNVKVMTLQDAFNRSKKFSDGKTFVPIQQNSQRVFSLEQEDHLSAYAIKIVKRLYGLPTTEFRRMVYTYAVACGSKSIPPAWEEEKMATRDWYYAFMSRHPELKLKTSITRATAFNKVSVDCFFRAYTEAMEKYCVSPDKIYNLDETSLSTVLKSVKVVWESREASLLHLRFLKNEVPP